MPGLATAPRAASAPGAEGGPAGRRDRRLLLAILALAFVLRLVWSLYAGRDPSGLNDPFTYLASAYGIAAGDGYRFFVDGSPTAYFPIGYPSFVAAVAWVAEHTPLDDVPRAVGVVQAVIGTASVWLVHRITSRLYGVRTGLVAAAIVALFPGLLMYSSNLLSETLFVFALLLALAVVIAVPWSADTPSWRHLAGFGVLMALAMLVRPQAVLLVIALVAAMAIAHLGRRRSLAAGGVVLATAVLTIAPWTIRNAITMDSFVPISSNLGDDLCIGHNDGARGHFAFYEDCIPPSKIRGGAQEVERSREGTRVALEHIWSHPRREAWLLVQKARYTYNGDSGAIAAAEAYGNARFLSSGLRATLTTVADVYFFLVVALGLVGSVLMASRRDARSTFLLLSLAAMALIPLAFFGDMRFHVPASPLFAIAAALALTRLLPRLRGRAPAA
jgi:4-amino-4-deoxy-L-arabinose transferase-like glycosyltransferase